MYIPYDTKAIECKGGIEREQSRPILICFPSIFPRKNTAAGYYRHIGLYAYRARFLQRFSRSPICPLEQVEHLEQLRALYYGFQIRIAVAEVPVETGIDTPYDLERIRQLFVNGG